MTEKPKFNIIIVGAGIAGLAASIGLAQQGHNVTILEGAHELAPIGIGIQIPPNAAVVLQKFGMLERMEKDAMNPTSFFFRRWEDSSIISEFAARQSATSGSLPYWSIRRSEYQRHLQEVAVEAGVTLRLGARVESLDLDKPAVTLVSGEVVQADLVIAADGIKSNLRKQVIPEEDTSIVLNPLSSFRTYVHRDDLLSDPLTAPIFEKTATNVWVGYSRHFICYPCGGGLYTVGATHPAGSEEAMNWSTEAPVEEAQKFFKDFDPVVNRVLSFAKNLKQWRLAEVPRLPRWTSQSGKVVLIGDAAHSMLQFLAQGAAMATEDAGALAECIERAKTVEDLPAVMRAFERTRKWRCEVVQAGSRRNGDLIHMPDGEEQENRDMAMKHQDQTGLWKADIGPFMDGEFRDFLYGHNVIEHAKKTLGRMQL